MTVPPSLLKLSGAFHQDVFVINQTIEGVLDYAIGFVTPAEAKEIRLYLVELLNGSRSSSEIRAVWNALDTDILIEDAKGMRSLLEQLRDRLPQD